MTVVASDIERARGVRIEDEVARRGHPLKRQGHELVGPCPVCGGLDRFSVNVRKQVWNCRGCGVGGDVIALVQHIDGCAFPEAVETLNGVRGHMIRKPALAEIERDRDQAYADRQAYEHRQLRLAELIWAKSQPLPPEAIAYFARRGIDVDSAPEDGSLRFHPRCLFDDELTPCVVARFTTVIGNEPRGIWRRPIDGRKPKTLGPMAGCVIRLWPNDAVQRRLVIGEGIETALAAATRITHRGTLLQPAWAAGSAANLAKFSVLPGVETLTLLVDHDSSGAGQKAAAACARRWSGAGREVTRLMLNRVGADFNDVVRP
jgi:phage/plasmid primase-like uncharacterized protein